MTSSDFKLRPYRGSDEEAAVELWQRTWQQAYPDIDFTERVMWWQERWRDELVPHASIVVAERDDIFSGFVTVDATGYLDQLVIDPECWGSSLGDSLLAHAKQISPQGITLLVNADNARAIRFYERNGFRHTHDDINPTSGRLVYGMEWKA